MSVITSLLVSIFGKIVADEIREWVFWLPPKLIRWAARQFDKEARARYEEEWLAHGNDLPGSLAKLSHGIGCTWAAVCVNCSPARMLLRAILRPLHELFTPVGLLFIVGIICALKVLGIYSPYETEPEFVRLKRLRKAAGGLCVLGLSQLALQVSDFQPALKSKHESLKFRQLMRSNIVLEVFDEEGSIVVDRYQRVILFLIR